MATILEADLNYTYNGLSTQEKERFRNSTVLITGCGGFLGYYFMHFFGAQAEALHIRKVIALDNFMLGDPDWIKKLRRNPIFDIRKFDIIKDRIAEVKGAEHADFVIHMASIASPMFYRRYPIETLDANVWGLRSLLDFYCEKPIKGFLFYSSSELYGDPDADHVPTSEEYYGYVCATGPRACYDESKRFGETLCMLFAQKYGMPIGVARPFNNYGPGMRIDDKRVPADFALAIKEDRDIERFADSYFLVHCRCGYRLSQNPRTRCLRLLQHRDRDSRDQHCPAGRYLCGGREKDFRLYGESEIRRFG